VESLLIKGGVPLHGEVTISGAKNAVLPIMAAALLLIEQPTWRTALLLALAVWGFCRFYYFAFYVIEHYVDPSYRFSGLWSFVCYLIRKRKKNQ
jgi:hypothetical protein